MSHKTFSVTVLTTAANDYCNLSCKPISAYMSTLTDTLDHQVQMKLNRNNRTCFLLIK